MNIMKNMKILKNIMNMIVMPSNNCNMKIFLRTSLDLRNFRNTDSIPNCDEVERENKTIFEENQIAIQSIVDIPVIV